jgi:glycosyltransferase involved in cell wall biosynthesis
MNRKLSIVIPCFNCTATLEEAVDSIFAQNLTTPFEIVMVDDKSKDSTIALMQRLAAIHPEIKLFYHTHNKGGGATRNTGIKNSTGDLIFCLDSDNLLYPNTMQKMVNYLVEKKCDGVVIHERRYFQEKDQAHYDSHINNILDRPITFENLFDDSSALLDNFLFTKEAYNKTEGYPEKHGFDTQCFELRFFAVGNTAYVCPNSIFLHRQAITTKGYFHRVYEEGLFSVNFYLIYEEILYLFSQESIHEIIMYDIFSKNRLGKENLKAFFFERYRLVGNTIFRNDFESYLVEGGLKKYEKNLSSMSTPEDTFIKAVILFRQKKFQAAYEIFKDLSPTFPNSKVIAYNLARCELSLVTSGSGTLIEKEAITKSGNKLITRKMALQVNPLKTILVRLRHSLCSLRTKIINNNV